MLIREGTSQDERFSPALDPASAQVDEHSVEHRMVFARTYARFLKYFDANNIEAGDWQPFFSSDVSVLLAVAAVQDVEFYKSRVQEYFAYLKNLGNHSDVTKAKDYLGFLFSCIGTLAKQLDVLKEDLPAEIPFKDSVRNLIRNQLAPGLQKLILYYRDGLTSDSSPMHRYLNDAAPTFTIMGEIPSPFKDIVSTGLSGDWIADDAATDWRGYLNRLYTDIAAYPPTGIYGSGHHPYDRINHIAAHNLFTSIFDQFLKAYARTVSEAERALAMTLAGWDRHEPHYTLFLVFLRLLEYARSEANSLTGRHLDFYYREILHLNEKAATAPHMHLLVELAKQVPQYLLAQGMLFKAGKDDLGKDVRFANDADFVANQAQVTGLKTVYRHRNSNNDSLPNQDNRLFAAPVANSDDGLGAAVTTPDQSWHPFFNKIYKDGQLANIAMPKAEIGFAVASHYLWLAGGTRTITVTFSTARPAASPIRVFGADGRAGGGKVGGKFARTTALYSPMVDNYAEASHAIYYDPADITCLFTSEKGWLEQPADSFTEVNGGLTLVITLDGACPAIAPYIAKIHGYDFDTRLPVLLLKLKHRDGADYLYSRLQDIAIDEIDLTVAVKNLKALAVSNDFGPVDTSKPFHPFGASPLTNSSLTIGSKEVFSKAADGQFTCSINAGWFTSPDAYNSEPQKVTVDCLIDGQWQPADKTAKDFDIYASPSNSVKNYPFSLASAISDAPDFSPNEHFGAESRNGFVRLRLKSDFGRGAYDADLLKYLKNVTVATFPGNPPVGPAISSLSMNYAASQVIAFGTRDVSQISGKDAHFYHLAPFGQAEQHSYLNDKKTIHLLPQFSEAEFYVGLTGLRPPQNLALLFQVADGTADPLSVKPPDHVQWSYLSGNEWRAFDAGTVADRTGGLLNSGIITFSVPRDADATNTLLPAGMHWLRAAVTTKCDAVCRLRLVAAQALEATFSDNGNDPNFPAKVLEAGTVGKLDQPVSEVKKIIQPFPGFGGRGRETPPAFYTRISERLRHKGRAIAMWDCERLVLEAFPQIYKVKCLNHTQYGPDETGKGVYRELAPGHVTVVTIPDQQTEHLRDPLRPFTSLGLLDEIAAFLGQRLSCFVTLHVRNPEFEEVLVDCKVRLHDGFDETFYKNELNSAITRFLSPWAFPDGGSPSFGGKIYESVLINFVEDLPYVDFVTDFQLFHKFLDGDGVQQIEKMDEISGSKAVSVLVSARNHTIDSFKPADAAPPGEKCLCEP
ncbi:MAG TPA: baseplate J/gp47 family protein [Geobacteraceae bacterium]